MADMEELIQEEAQHFFGERVYAIKHLGTYNCREMAAYPGWVSEHSYANAIDVVSFTLAKGTEISVRRHYFEDSPRGAFLRAVARRAYEEDVFSETLDQEEAASAAAASHLSDRTEFELALAA